MPDLSNLPIPPIVGVLMGVVAAAAAVFAAWRAAFRPPPSMQQAPMPRPQDTIVHLGGPLDLMMQACRDIAAAAHRIEDDARATRTAVHDVKLIVTDIQRRVDRRR